MKTKKVAQINTGLMTWKAQRFTLKDMTIQGLKERVTICSSLIDLTTQKSDFGIQNQLIECRSGSQKNLFVNCQSPSPPGTFRSTTGSSCRCYFLCKPWVVRSKCIVSLHDWSVMIQNREGVVEVLGDHIIQGR